MAHVQWCSQDMAKWGEQLIKKIESVAGGFFFLHLCFINNQMARNNSFYYVEGLIFCIYQKFMKFQCTFYVHVCAFFLLKPP